MENIEKCLVIALNELGKISFSGQTVIPAGRAMGALLLAQAEVNRIKAEKANKDQKAAEGADKEKGGITHA